MNAKAGSPWFPRPGRGRPRRSPRRGRRAFGDVRRDRRHDRRLLLSALLHLLLRGLGRRAHVPGQQRLQVPQGKPLGRRGPLRRDRVAQRRPRRRVAQEPGPRHGDGLGARDVRPEDDLRAARCDRETARRRVSREVEETHDARGFDHVAGRREEVAREDGERTRGDQPRQDLHAPPRPERARGDPEPPVLELDVERRIQSRLLDASFNGADGDPKFSWEKRNGFTITWTARGGVDAAAAKADGTSM